MPAGVQVSHSAIPFSPCANLLTGDGAERNLGALGGTADQLDGDGAGGVLGGSGPLDGEGLASGDDLVGAGAVDGVKVGSLGKGGGGQSQESGNRQSESHLDG